LDAVTFEHVEQGAPEGDESFVYIDIGSVDNN